MITLPAGLRIWVASEPVDFRKGMDSLAALVQEHLRQNPYGDALFVFRAKRADRVKILFWNGTGLCLFQKRLEQGQFIWPSLESGTVVVTGGQLSILTAPPWGSRSDVRHGGCSHSTIG